MPSFAEVKVLQQQNMLNVHHMHTWVCTLLKWNYEQHLYTHTLISIINRFASTNAPLMNYKDIKLKFVFLNFCSQPLGGCLRDLIGIRYSMFPTGVNFLQDSPQGRSRAGKSRSHRGPYFDLNFSFIPNCRRHILIKTFHTIVVPDPWANHDLDSRSYLQVKFTLHT